MSRTLTHLPGEFPRCTREPVCDRPFQTERRALTVVILPYHPRPTLSLCLKTATKSIHFHFHGGFRKTTLQSYRIGSHSSALQNARIISTCRYTESIVHRFLILELQRDGKNNTWIRLDRRRAKIVGTISFLLCGWLRNSAGE